MRETSLAASDFVQPLFITYGSGVRREIGSMPGQYQLSVDELPRELAGLAELGIKAVLLFGIPEDKDREAKGAFDPDGVIQRALRAIKREMPEMLTIADVCACEYTDHGHCGILDGCGDVDNDRTVAAAGADRRQSGRRRGGHRRALGHDGWPRGGDSRGAGHGRVTSICRSCPTPPSTPPAFYGPFREAAASTPAFGDRRSHQMDPANAREALTEIAIDLDEGADIVIVKPALAYLDVIRMARDAFDAPILAYNVSGEYAMIKAAAQLGWIDERRVTLETLTSMKRAGAGRIITYHAKEAAAWLRDGDAANRHAVNVLSEWGA